MGNETYKYWGRKNCRNKVFSKMFIIIIPGKVKLIYIFISWSSDYTYIYILCISLTIRKYLKVESIKH